MKHYLKYVVAPFVAVIWSFASAEANTQMRVWINTDCQGEGYDWPSYYPPGWAGSYQNRGPQGLSGICYVNNSSFQGMFDSFVQCVQDGQASASFFDHAACAIMSVGVVAAVTASIVGTGGLTASGWLWALGVLSGATAGYTYSSICYCALHS